MQPRSIVLFLLIPIFTSPTKALDTSIAENNADGVFADASVLIQGIDVGSQIRHLIPASKMMYDYGSGQNYPREAFVLVKRFLPGQILDRLSTKRHLPNPIDLMFEDLIRKRHEHLSFRMPGIAIGKRFRSLPTPLIAYETDYTVKRRQNDRSLKKRKFTAEPFEVDKKPLVAILQSLPAFTNAFFASLGKRCLIHTRTGRRRGIPLGYSISEPRTVYVNGNGGKIRPSAGNHANLKRDRSFEDWGPSIFKEPMTANIPRYYRRYFATLGKRNLPAGVGQASQFQTDQKRNDLDADFDQWTTNIDSTIFDNDNAYTQRFVAALKKRFGFMDSAVGQPDGGSPNTEHGLVVTDSPKRDEKVYTYDKYRPHWMQQSSTKGRRRIVSSHNFNRWNAAKAGQQKPISSSFANAKEKLFHRYPSKRSFNNALQTKIEGHKISVEAPSGSVGDYFVVHKRKYTADFSTANPLNREVVSSWTPTTNIGTELNPVDSKRSFDIPRFGRRSLARYWPRFRAEMQSTTGNKPGKGAVSKIESILHSKDRLGHASNLWNISKRPRWTMGSRIRNLAFRNEPSALPKILHTPAAAITDTWYTPPAALMWRYRNKLGRHKKYYRPFETTVFKRPFKDAQVVNEIIQQLAPSSGEKTRRNPSFSYNAPINWSSRTRHTPTYYTRYYDTLGKRFNEDNSNKQLADLKHQNDVNNQDASYYQTKKRFFDPKSNRYPAGLGKRVGRFFGTRGGWFSQPDRLQKYPGVRPMNQFYKRGHIRILSNFGRGLKSQNNAVSSEKRFTGPVATSEHASWMDNLLSALKKRKLIEETFPYDESAGVELRKKRQLDGNHLRGFGKRGPLDDQIPQPEESGNMYRHDQDKRGPLDDEFISNLMKHIESMGVDNKYIYSAEANPAEPRVVGEYSKRGPLDDIFIENLLKRISASGIGREPFDNEWMKVKDNDINFSKRGPLDDEFMVSFYKRIAPLHISREPFPGEKGTKNYEMSIGKHSLSHQMLESQFSKRSKLYYMLNSLVRKRALLPEASQNTWMNERFDRDVLPPIKVKYWESIDDERRTSAYKDEDDSS